jgi:hypothetical protein
VRLTGEVKRRARNARVVPRPSPGSLEKDDVEETALGREGVRGS